MLYTVLFLLVGVGVAGSMFVVWSPQVGAPAKGQRLERIKKSPNFNGKVFSNPVPTVMERPPFSVLMEMMKGNKNRTPDQALPTLPIDKAAYAANSPQNLLVTWLGHSSVLLQTDGINMLIDPVFSRRASLVSFAGPQMFDYEVEHQVSDLPNIELVLLTHDHYDHLDKQTIEALRPLGCTFVTPLGVGAHLERWGVAPEQIIELDLWEEFRYKTATITATPSRHFTGRGLTNRFKTLWCGFAIATPQHKVFHSGDSGYFNGFKQIGEKLGPFDLAFLECGQYNEAWHNIHMMPEESAQAAVDVNARIAIPIHWGKFPLSLHNWNEPPTRFEHKAQELGVNYLTPQIGEAFNPEKAQPNTWWKK